MTLILIGVAVVVKLVFGRWVKKVGEKVESGSLVASGQDAIMDSVLSSATLVAAILNYVWGWQIEGYLGVVIAIMILRTAWEVWTEATDNITGPRADAELVRRVRAVINSFPEVEGTYDLNIHDYGPEKLIATAHIQVPDMMKAGEIHELTHEIAEKVYEEFGFVLTLGIYAANDRGKAGKIKKDLEKVVAGHPEIVQMHGFFVEEMSGRVYFDLIVNWNQEKPEEVRDKIVAEMKKKWPEYQYIVVLDTDVTE